MSFTKEMYRRAGESYLAKLKLPGWLFSKTTGACLAILGVAYLAYGLFFVPAIFMDDWTTVIERLVTGNAKWFDLAWRRPLLFAPLLLQYQVLGLNVTGYYLVLGALYMLMAILLYKIVNRFPLAHRHTFGLVMALLFLVYPTNYTHMWLIMVGVYCGIVLTLLYGYLLLIFAGGGSWLTLGLALLCLLLSLGLYEGQVGVATAWAMILVVLYYGWSTLQRTLSLLTPVGLIGLFSLWRTVGYQTVGITDQYLSQVVITPNVVLSRLLLGYKISLGWGWTAPLEQFLGWAGGAKSALLLLVGGIGVMWWLLSRIMPKSGDGATQTRLAHRRSLLRPYFVAAITGLLLIGAGYVPILVVYLPSLSGIGSRFNIFATIGSTLFLASLFMLGSLLVAKNRAQVKYFFLTAALPFLILGIVTQAAVQYDNRVAWREQQTIWQELFSVAPNLKDDTLVLFILPGYQDRAGFQNWRRTPLSASWEASSGMRLLYDNVTLAGDVYFPDIEEPIEPRLTAEGVYSPETDRVTPYAQTVAFVYDNSEGTLTHWAELPTHLTGGAETVKLCTDCLLSERVSNVPLRRLVQD